DIADIAAVVRELGIDALICGNTTITRPASLRSAAKGAAGGLSGQPLKPVALQTLTELYVATNGEMPRTGAGGIREAAEACARTRAGASLIRLYSAMVYEGPCLAEEIARGIAKRLRAAGFDSVRDGVGVDAALA